MLTKEIPECAGRRLQRALSIWLSDDLVLRTWLLCGTLSCRGSSNDPYLQCRRPQSGYRFHPNQNLWPRCQNSSIRPAAPAAEVHPSISPHPNQRSCSQAIVCNDVGALLIFREVANQNCRHSLNAHALSRFDPAVARQDDIFVVNEDGDRKAKRLDALYQLMELLVSNAFARSWDEALAP